MASRKKLILHVGLPKTGTSALQRWCNSNRSDLLARDINYPETYNDADPKHQFLVSALQQNELQWVQTVLSKNQSQILVLSTEGLTNHLYDFRPAALKNFRDLTSGYDIVVFMVIRDAPAWIKSYYTQCVINPPGIPGFHYGTELRYRDFCALPRVQRLADSAALKEDVGIAFGASNIVVAQYEDAWMREFLQLVGIDDRADLAAPEHINLSVDDDLTDIIRQINAMTLLPEDRREFLSIIQACFRTKQSTLMQMHKAAAPERSGRSAEVASRLVAETAAQTRLIEQLSQWLASDSRDDIA